VSGWEALNRGDLDVAFALYHPDVVSEFDQGLLSVGFENTRTRDARIDVQREALAGFRELSFEAKELLHVGNARVLTVGRMRGSGLSSGAAFDTEWAALFTISAGRAIHEQVFLACRPALEAVGLRE
jgi:ketosteroid isomerase-like protein